MRKRLLIFLLFFGAFCAAAQSLRVVSYNVENLFHPEQDSINTDTEWTPDGERRWSFARYFRKEENIARVLTAIGEWDGVDIVGLQEVENEAVVKRLCHTLRPSEYGWVHYDSPDRRGIDVALIYKKARIDTLRTRAIQVEGERRTANGVSQEENVERLGMTRDILYVECLADRQDTLHFFVCHLPSQRGGAAESAWKRAVAKQVLQRAVDSVTAIHPQARIIVMGDMNSAPQEDIKGLNNRMIRDGLSVTGYGTHKYQGRWTCLDQFYTSPALDSVSEVKIYNAEWIQEPDEKYLDLRPKRTYNGFRYQNGYSDHLPIILMLKR